MDFDYTIKMILNVQIKFIFWLKKLADNKTSSFTSSEISACRSSQYRILVRDITFFCIQFTQTKEKIHIAKLKR